MTPASASPAHPRSSGAWSTSRPWLVTRAEAAPWPSTSARAGWHGASATGATAPRWRSTACSSSRAPGRSTASARGAPRGEGVTVGRVARAAAVVAALGLVSRLLGFLREIVMSGVYGTSAQADSFVNGLFIVNTVAAVLLYALVTLVIPVFLQERERAGTASAWRLLSAIAAWTGIVLIALSSVVAIWPELPTALFHLGDPVRIETTERLIRIMAPALALQGFSALFTALLQVHGRFAGPAAVGVAFNLGIIAGVAIGQSRIGI